MTDVADLPPLRIFLVPLPYTGDPATIRRVISQRSAHARLRAEEAAGRGAILVYTRSNREYIHTMMVEAKI